MWSKRKQKQTQKTQRSDHAEEDEQLDFHFSPTTGISNPWGDTQTEIPETKVRHPGLFFVELFII